MSKATVLIADDDDDLRHAISQTMQLIGYEVHEYGQAQAVLSHIHRELNGVLITDVRMPGMDGMELLTKVLDIDPALPVIVITGHGEISTAVEAMRDGAYDFIEKPFETKRLSNAVARALEKRRLVLENRSLRQELSGQSELDKRLVGQTPAMLKLRTEIIALAPTDVDVLIWGDTGSGKEVVARALHEESPRCEKPFVALNCGAIPVDMMESELFGHESGAFTSANKRRIGKLEYASGGTIFLDEIESMPLELQVKLLRVIETRSIERLGSNQMIPLDLRFVAATKTDLEAFSQQGHFRSDLYYRLNVVTLTIPSLRERKDDIPSLVHHLAREARARFGKDIPDMDANIMAELLAYDWPGNVRELRNIVDRWVLGLGVNISKTSHYSATLMQDLPTQMATIEKSIIINALSDNVGKIKSTYEALGISRKALYEKMKKYQIDVKSTDTPE